MAQLSEKDSLSTKQKRVEYLEKLAQWHLFSLQILASLGELQHNASLSYDSERIFSITRDHLRKLIKFRVMAFFMVEEKSNDFVMLDIDPADSRAQLQSEIDILIENGTFAWALNQNHPVTVKPVNFENHMVLHVLATQSRVRGMFAGIVSSDSPYVDETIAYPMSIILQYTANALESIALYKIFKNQNQLLEETVKTRTGELEEQTVKLREEIAYRKLAEEALIVAKEEAETAARVKSEFLDNISHEIRTPLNAILGYSEILHYELSRLDRSEFLDDLKAIESAGRHLLTLINDILDISKIQAGKMEIFPEDFHIQNLLDEVSSTTQILAVKNNNTFVIEKLDDIGSMRSDITRIRQILLNLLSNACKFTHQGEIRLSVSREWNFGVEWARFVVTDTGIGIKTENIEKIFGEFMQEDSSTTRKYGGTGLGLAISRRLANLLHGQLTVESEFGKGSNFTLLVPTDHRTPQFAKDKHLKPPQALESAVEAGEKGAKERVETSEKKDTSTEVPPAAKTILVIDDDPIVRDLIKRFLVKEGYWVVAAQSGEEGLLLARKLRPRIITLDIMMPDMDGWQILQQLKNEQMLRNIPVIMLSVVDDKEKGFALGAADYINKPLNWDNLIQAIKKLDKKPASKSILYVDGDVTGREMLGHLLIKEGFSITKSENAQKAAEYLAQGAPSLILLSLFCEEGNSFELINQLKRHGEWKNIPVLILAARELSVEERQRLHPSVKSIFYKGGFTRQELLESINRNIA